MRHDTPQSTSTLSLEVSLGNLVLKNPIVTASGTFGSGKEYAPFVDLASLGAVVTKGVSPTAWKGNAGPRIAETASGMLNSIGLQNAGVEVFCERDLAWLAQNAPLATVIVNVCGHSVDEYVKVIERLESEPMIAAYELNISCPNVDSGGLAFGTSCAGAEQVTSACRKVTNRPIIVKLSPNVGNISEIARSVEAAGADSVSLINTLLGMAINPYTRKPVFSRKVAGLSGPAIKPVALRMVHEVSQAVAIPLVGMGGARSGLDVVEFLLAGASAVAIGTASFGDPQATIRCISELQEYMTSQGVKDVTELIGALE